MVITTKKGDGGYTLLNNKKVRKDDKVLEFYGCVDELCAFLSITEQNLLDEESVDTVDSLQSMLLARDFTEENLNQLTTIIDEQSADLTYQIDGDVDNETEMFIKMGSSLRASHLHYCRVLSQKIERRAISANQSPLTIKFFNRLSDFLYLMAIVEDAEAVE
jgi:ATP:cob(I)alamin adenosyltransferase